MRRFSVCLLACLGVIPPHAVAADSHPTPQIQSRTGTPTRQVATILIPKLRLSAPIYIGVTDAIFNKGIGQWPGTPSAGKNGNIVLGGHRTSADALFVNIDKLKSGDTITLVARNKTFKYSVTGHSIVKPNAIWITKQTSTPTLTLFSCHPLGKVSHRYVVRAVLTS